MNMKRVAWIVGASSGIGKALAVQLVEEGYFVAISARRPEELDTMVEASGGQMRAFVLDVCDKQAVAATRAEIEAVVGPISLAVCSAGTYIRDDPANFQTGIMRKMVEVNLMGTSHFLEAIIPPMINRGTGQIGILSSVSGYTGLPGGGVYGATKSALITLAQALYPQLRRNGVHLSVICPGFVKTPLTDQNDFPMPFMISAEDAAKRISRGLKNNVFEIAFPRRMVFALKLLRLLPYRLYFTLTDRMVRD